MKWRRTILYALLVVLPLLLLVDDVCRAQDPPVCGNGVIEGTEECDDNNTVNDDGCSNACTLPRCGDNITQAILNETCDDGNTYDFDTCTNVCQLPYCGDGLISVGIGEQCDDQNQVNDDYCRNDCILPICGDGIVQAVALSEECDDQNTVDTDNCTNACHLPICGDGILWEGYEECDDQNTDSNDACTNTCRLAYCGDGIVQFGVEECDNGNTDNSEDCTNACTIPPQIGMCVGVFQPFNTTCQSIWPLPFGADPGVCTILRRTDASFNITQCNATVAIIDIFENSANCSGIATLHVEALTNGNQCSIMNEAHSVVVNCTCLDPPYCGDGITQPGNDEECDDANDVNNDWCTNACRNATCGDGIVQFLAGEQCEDGNQINTDACSNTCQSATCGDGIIQASNGEQCDDTNAINTDGCTNACQLPICGDGFIFAGIEECDDANTDPGDGCDGACQCQAMSASITDVRIAIKTTIPQSNNRVYRVDVTLLNNGGIDLHSAELLYVSGPGIATTPTTFTLDPQEYFSGGQSIVLSFDLFSIVQCSLLFDAPSHYLLTITSRQSDLAAFECAPGWQFNYNLTTPFPKLCGDRCVSTDVLEQCDNPGESCCVQCQFASNTTACDDADWCTMDDHCDAGFCISGDPVVCTPIDECHAAGQCDSLAELCTNPAVANGRTCGSFDSAACISRSRCVDGQCAPVIASDNTPCDANVTCSHDSYCLSGDCIVNAVCGDGCALDGMEECDDGNEDNTDDCLNDCTVARFGDGFVRAGLEQCDDNNFVDGDGCSGNGTCDAFTMDSMSVDVVRSNYVSQTQRRLTLSLLYTVTAASPLSSFTASLLPIDNVLSLSNCEQTWMHPTVSTVFEFTCDIGVSPLRLNEVIQFVVLGNARLTETCAPQTISSSPIAVDVETVCGNGQVEAPDEECDDGNAIADDGCTNDCTLPRCGDGIVQLHERCDDGNTLDGDCCSATCKIECTHGRTFWIDAATHANRLAGSSNSDALCSIDIEQCANICAAFAFGGSTCNTQACISTCKLSAMGFARSRIMPLRTLQADLSPCIQLIQELELFFLNALNGGCVSASIRSAVFEKLVYEDDEDDDLCNLAEPPSIARSPVMDLDCPAFATRIAPMLATLQTYNEGGSSDGPVMCDARSMQHCNGAARFHVADIINRILVKEGQKVRRDEAAAAAHATP